MPYPVDAAFRSSTNNQCYVFAKEKYVVVKYGPDEKKENIINGPIHISDGFPMLARMVFQNGIDCAFDIKDIDNEAYIFSGNQCAKIKYTPHSSNSRLLIGPIPFASMFPDIKGTILENGINAILHYYGDNVFLFKGNKLGYLNYKTKCLHWTYYILSYFPYLDGTIFESGIDAAFNSHKTFEGYLFKGEYYVRISYDIMSKEGNHMIGGRLKRISNDWPALRGILHY